MPQATAQTGLPEVPRSALIARTLCSYALGKFDSQSCGRAATYKTFVFLKASLSFLTLKCYPAAEVSPGGTGSAGSPAP